MSALPRLIVALLLPALAIVVAAGGQEVLSLAFPSMTNVSVGPVTLGSYVGVALQLLVCAFVGTWLARKARSVFAICASEVVPVAFAAALLYGVLPHNGTTNWHILGTWVMFAVALSPAVGVALGWFASSGRVSKEGA